MGLTSSNFSLTNTNTTPACARTSAHASHLPLPVGSARGEAEFENCPLAVARGQPSGLGCEPKITLEGVGSRGGMENSTLRLSLRGMKWVSGTTSSTASASGDQVPGKSSRVLRRQHALPAQGSGPGEAWGGRATAGVKRLLKYMSAKGRGRHHRGVGLPSPGTRGSGEGEE